MSRFIPPNEFTSAAEYCRRINAQATAFIYGAIGGIATGFLAAAHFLT